MKEDINEGNKPKRKGTLIILFFLLSILVGFFVYLSLTNKLPIQLNKKICIWNALKENGEHLNSGVYIYYIKTQNKDKKGKLVIIND